MAEQSTNVKLTETVGKLYPDDIILAAEQMMAKSPKARRWGNILDERVVAVWRRWLDDGIGYDAIAQNNGLGPISESTVRRLVAQYPAAQTSAPVPYPPTKRVTPASHDVAPASRAVARPAVKRAAAKVETAVVPVQATAVATNGYTDLREQLGVIQELLGLAEAQSVTLRGKISVDLHAEVAF